MYVELQDGVQNTFPYGNNKVCIVFYTVYTVHRILYCTWYISLLLAIRVWFKTSPPLNLLISQSHYFFLNTQTHTGLFQLLLI